MQAFQQHHRINHLDPLPFASAPKRVCSAGDDSECGAAERPEHLRDSASPRANTTVTLDRNAEASFPPSSPADRVNAAPDLQNSCEEQSDQQPWNPPRAVPNGVEVRKSDPAKHNGPGKDHRGSERDRNHAQSYIEPLRSQNGPPLGKKAPYPLTSILIGPSARPWMNWST